MLKAKVSNILQKEGVCCIEFESAYSSFCMLGLELPQNLHKNSDVVLNFKSSNVILSKDKLQNCSLSNEIFSTIAHIDTGDILTVITLKNQEFEFQSIITTNSFKKLNLCKNMQVYAYLKATSIFISEIL